MSIGNKEKLLLPSALPDMRPRWRLEICRGSFLRLSRDKTRFRRPLSGSRQRSSVPYIALFDFVITIRKKYSCHHEWLKTRPWIKSLRKKNGNRGSFVFRKFETFQNVLMSLVPKTHPHSHKLSRPSCSTRTTRGFESVTQQRLTLLTLTKCPANRVAFCQFIFSLPTFLTSVSVA